MAQQANFLPPELWIYVVEQLSNIDLKSARLASRSLKAIVNPFLFRAVTFSRQEEHQRTFQAISEHPDLRQHVRELRYNITRIYSFGSEYSFKSLLKLSDPESAAHKQDYLCKEYHKAVLSIHALTSSELASQLANGLRLLPDIKLVLIAQDTEQTGWFKKFPFLLYTYEAWYNAQREFMLYWDHKIILDNVMRPTDFNAIAYAVQANDARVREFSSIIKSDSNIVDWRRTPELLWMDRQTAITCFSFFRGLVSLSVTLNERHGFSKLLQECKVLKHLCLDFRIHSHGAIGHPSARYSTDELTSVFLPTTWYSSKQDKSEYGVNRIDEPVIIPSLQTLSLSNMMTSGQTLICVLKNHKIKALSLHNIYCCCLSDSESIKRDWEAVLDLIRSLDLQSFAQDRVAGFLRNVSGEPVTSIPSGISNEDRTLAENTFSYDTMAPVDPRILKVWSELPNRRRDFVYELQKSVDLNTIRGLLQHHMDPWRQAMRIRIAADRDQLDPLIMDYARGKSDVNPLRFLSTYEQMNWPEDAITRSGVLDD